MNTLKELVRIVSPKKIQGIALPREGDSKLMKLYYGIVEGQFKTDEEAAEALYGVSDPGSKYAKLKHDLRKRLTSLLFLLNFDSREYPKVFREFFKCHINWVAVKILFTLGATQTAVKMLKKLLKQARKYEFLEIVTDCYRLLRAYHGNSTGQQKKVAEYTRKVGQYLRLQEAEITVEGFYYDLLAYYVTDKSTKQFISELAGEYLNRLLAEPPERMTNNYFFKFKMIELIQYMSVHDYERTIRVCREAADFFRAKSFFHPQHLAIFYCQWIASCIFLGRYEEGRRNVRECLRLLRKGNYNWYQAKKLEVQLAFYSGDYQKSYLVCAEMFRSHDLRKQHQLIQEEWRLFEAYVQLLVLSGKFKEQGQRKKLRRFRLNRFLNEFTLFSKDKCGMNIPILVAQTLLLISESKYDQVIDRLEALEKYAYRHLKKEELVRSSLFIQLLQQVVDSGFRYKEVRERGECLLQRLRRAAEDDILSRNHHIEIIPYEDLWQIVLALLLRSPEADHSDDREPFTGRRSLNGFGKDAPPRVAAALQGSDNYS